MAQAGSNYLRPPPVRHATEARQSIMSSISRLWRPANAASNASASPNVGNTFVVPLFLAASRSASRNEAYARGALPSKTRSRSSTRSLIEDHAPPRSRVQPLSVSSQNRREGSDMYGPSAVPNLAPEASFTTTTTTEEQSTHAVSRSSTRSSRPRSNRTRRGDAHAHAKRSFRDPKVSSKLRISIAFGVTFITALTIYVVLSATGTANNIMFHVLSILFLLALAGIFLHQFILMLMLRRRPMKTKRRKPTHHRRNGEYASTRRARPKIVLEDEVVPEKPVQIRTAEDRHFGPDVEHEAGLSPVRVPPPVYGNYRESVRMNPDYVHWRQVQPTPLTPSYDEALNSVQQEVGYRPPSYISEGGMTEVIERQGQDVDEALSTIHPLERERMRNLTADALEGRR